MTCEHRGGEVQTSTPKLEESGRGSCSWKQQAARRGSLLSLCCAGLLGGGGRGPRPTTSAWKILDLLMGSGGHQRVGGGENDCSLHLLTMACCSRGAPAGRGTELGCLPACLAGGMFCRQHL